MKMNGALVLLAIGSLLILLGAPSREVPPARPEPGARRIIAAVFGDDE
ncbi:hypothetical protein [Microbacterium sp.]